jgi:hypothetical protein
MNDPFAWFWAAMIAASIAWYTFLLFYLGIKGGFDIYRMTRVFGKPPQPSPDAHGVESRRAP